MTVRLTQYLMRDGLTRLSEEYFNPVWGDLDRRLDMLERLSISWETAIDDLQINGLTRLNEILIPLIDAAEAELEGLIEATQGLTNLVTGAAIDYWRPGISGEVDYDGNGRVTTVTDVLPDNSARLSTFAYNQNGQLVTETVDVGQERRVTTYTYDGNGLLQAWTVEVTEL